MQERTRRRSAFATILCFVASMLSSFTPEGARGRILPPFTDHYTEISLGQPEGLPHSYGAIVFDRDDSDVLLMVGAALENRSCFFEVRVLRDVDGHIIGFSGPAVQRIAVPDAGGGAAVHPQRTLFVTQPPRFEIGQVRHGSSMVDKSISITSLGLDVPVSGIAFVPLGYPGERRLKLLSAGAGRWYSAEAVPDGTGLFDLSNVSLVTHLGAGFETMTYVPPGSPEFADFESVLITQWTSGSVVAFRIDEVGDPMWYQRQTFADLLPGAEGIVADPVTGDFVVTASGLGFGPDWVWVVRGFGQPISTVPASWGSVKARYR